MVKLPSKAFLKVVPKSSESNRYSILTPWLAMVQGRWCFCATNGKSAIMRPVPVEDHATEHLPAAAKVAIPTECFKEGEPVEIVENEKAGKAGSYVVRSKSGTERRCPEVCPPDLDGLMRPDFVSNDRMEIIVDAKILVGVLEAMLSDITAKSSCDESYVKLSFARMQREGDTETYIDSASPMMLEREIRFQGGVERALVMPVSSDEPAKKRVKAARSASTGASTNVDAEERVAMAKEGGVNA